MVLEGFWGIWVFHFHGKYSEERTQCGLNIALVGFGFIFPDNSTFCSWLPHQHSPLCSSHALAQSFVRFLSSQGFSVEPWAGFCAQSPSVAVGMEKFLWNSYGWRIPMEKQHQEPSFGAFSRLSMTPFHFPAQQKQNRS